MNLFHSFLSGLENYLIKMIGNSIVYLRRLTIEKLTTKEDLDIFAKGLVKVYMEINSTRKLERYYVGSSVVATPYMDKFLNTPYKKPSVVFIDAGGFLSRNRNKYEYLEVLESNVVSNTILDLLSGLIDTELPEKPFMKLLTNLNEWKFKSSQY